MARTTPTSADLIPEVIELLKRKQKMKKAEILSYMQSWISLNRFTQRDRSTGWALNRLAKEGYVAHPQIGTWEITAKGTAASITTDEAREMVRKWNARERQ
jgi:Mn-dependent DtxR family transcriptional regulator